MHETETGCVASSVQFLARACYVGYDLVAAPSCVWCEAATVAVHQLTESSSCRQPYVVRVSRGYYGHVGQLNEPFWSTRLAVLYQQTG
jgi:hypothetical protein